MSVSSTRRGRAEANAPASPAQAVPAQTESPEVDPAASAVAAGGEVESASRHATEPGRLWLQVGFSLSLLVLAGLVLFLIRDVVGAFVLGTLLAFIILPAVDAMDRGGVPRPLGILVCYIALGLGVWLLISALLPLFNEEFTSLVAQAPSLASAAQYQLAQLVHGTQLQVFGYTIDLSLYAGQVATNLNGFLLGQFANALSLGVTAITTLLQLLLLLIVTFLVSLNAHQFSAFMRRMVPPDYRPDFDQIWSATKRMLYAYLRGQLAVAALIGIFTTVAVSVLGIKYPLALGLLAGVSALVPYIGPYLGAIPAVLLALVAGPYQALAVAAAYVVISNVVFNLVSPRVVGNAVQLPSLLVIVAFLAGFSLAGILGMFIAVPLAAFLRIVYAHVHPRLFGA